MSKRVKGKVFPYAPVCCSTPLVLLPYGTQGEVAEAGLPFLCLVLKLRGIMINLRIVESNTFIKEEC